jgi:pilus assembly protein CpaB
MNTRVLLTLAFAMIFGLAAGYSALRYLNSRPEVVQAGSGDGETVPVVLAARDLALGTVLEDTDLQVVQWPANALPAGYASTVEELVDQSLVADVSANEAILDSKLGGGLRGIIPLIPEGMRAMTIAVDQVIGVAGFVSPQTRVDVILIMAPQGSEDTVSKIILQNIRALARGEEIRETEDGTPVTVPTVTVAVTPEEAEKLALASNQGVIRLALRHALDLQAVDTRGERASRLFAGTPGPLSRPSTRVGTTSPSAQESIIAVYRGGAQSLIRY